MAVHRGIDGSEPVRPQPIGRLAGPHEERLASRSVRLATGTLACPGCDAPVAPAAGPLSPADPLACPFCRHAAPVRDFLSLSTPTRPARVELRVVHRAQPAARSTTPWWAPPRPSTASPWSRAIGGRSRSIERSSSASSC